MSIKLIQRSVSPRPSGGSSNPYYTGYAQASVGREISGVGQQIFQMGQEWQRRREQQQAAQAAHEFDKWNYSFTQESDRVIKERINKSILDDPNAQGEIADPFSEREAAYIRQRQAAAAQIGGKLDPRARNAFNAYVRDRGLQYSIRHQELLRDREIEYRQTHIKNRVSWDLGRLNDAKLAGDEVLAQEIEDQIWQEVSVDAGWFTPEEFSKFRQEMEIQEMYDMISKDPDRAIEEINKSKLLPDDVQRSLVRTAQIERNTKKEIEKEKIKDAQYQIHSSMLADIWEGKNSDPHTITSALRTGSINATQAGQLRSAMLAPIETDLVAWAEADDFVSQAGMGMISKPDALKEIMSRSSSLSRTDGKSLIQRLGSDVDRHNEKNFSDAITAAKGIILGEDSQDFDFQYITDERKNLAFSEIRLQLRDEWTASLKSDRPWSPRELTERANQLALLHKQRILNEEYGTEIPIDEMPEPQTVQEFEGEVARLKQIDMEKAKQYYDKFAGKRWQ